MKITDIPEDISIEFNLGNIVTNNESVLSIMAILRMHGLSQVELLANDELIEKRLNESYFQSKLVPGLWRHELRPIQFTPVIDDFGVKYVGKEHVQHLE